MAFPSNPYIGQTCKQSIRITSAELVAVGVVSGMTQGSIAKVVKPILEKKIKASLGALAGKLLTPVLVVCEAAGFYGVVLQALGKNGIEVSMEFEYKRIQYCQQGACTYMNDWVIKEGIRVTTY